MKKLMFLLGSLIIVSASAEDISTVKIINPTEFKPTGTIGIEYRAYGETEGHNDKITKATEELDAINDEWNRGANDYSRLETTFAIQMTEKFKLDGRIRDYNNIKDNSGNNLKIGTDTRLRLFYKHNDLLTSKIEYRDTNKNYEQYAFDLKYNIYSNKNGFLDSVSIIPKFKHEDQDHSNYTNKLSTELAMTGNLLFGITWENNYYINYNMYNHSKPYANNKSKDSEFSYDIELYLFKTFELYKSTNNTIALNLEGGFDPYTFYQYKHLTASTPAISYNKEYSLYSTIDLSTTYLLTDNISLKGGIGAEYRNWDKIVESEAKNWRWQPFAYVGTNIKF